MLPGKAESLFLEIAWLGLVIVDSKERKRIVPNKKNM